MLPLYTYHGLVSEFKIKQQDPQNERCVFEHGMGEPSMELPTSDLLRLPYTHGMNVFSPNLDTVFAAD